MKRFIEGESRNQSTLFPELLDDYVGEDNPVRVIDVLLMNLIWVGLVSVVLNRMRQADHLIILQSC